MTKKHFKKIILPVIIFIFSILPFFAVIPWLEFKYAGAVLNKTDPAVKNIFNFIYNYLANFDPSFLFIKGDELLIHSTGTHGMYLLASLPFFILGLINSWKKSSFWNLIIISFFAGPLLFGYIGQVHRANRLLAEIPLYSLISASGFIFLLQRKSKILVGVLMILFMINYFNFINYYWNNFASDTKNLYFCYSCADGAYKILKSESIARGLTPFIDQVDLKGESAVRDFIKTIYFERSPISWDGDKKILPSRSILMTDNGNITYLNQINHFDRYYFYINK